MTLHPIPTNGCRPGHECARCQSLTTDAYALGYEDGAGGVGMTYDDDPESPRSRAYDAGRTVRRVIEGWEGMP